MNNNTQDRAALLRLQGDAIRLRLDALLALRKATKNDDNAPVYGFDIDGWPRTYVADLSATSHAAADHLRCVQEFLADETALPKE